MIVASVLVELGDYEGSSESSDGMNPYEPPAFAGDVKTLDLLGLYSDAMHIVLVVELALKVPSSFVSFYSLAWGLAAVWTVLVCVFRVVIILDGKLPKNNYTVIDGNSKADKL